MLCWGRRDKQVDQTYFTHIPPTLVVRKTKNYTALFLKKKNTSKWGAFEVHTYGGLIVRVYLHVWLNCNFFSDQNITF